MDTTTSKSKQTENTTAEKNQDNSNYSITPIEGTPFNMYYNENEGYAVIMGNNRVTKFHETEEEAKDKVAIKNIETIIEIAAVIANTLLNKEKY